MGDVGDDFCAYDDGIRLQRQRSLEAALGQFETARAAARAAGLDILISNSGHHWRFCRHGDLVLNFWPASAKAMRPGKLPFRARGWKHALAVAEKP
jgi:hypothetical protein